MGRGRIGILGAVLAVLCGVSAGAVSAAPATWAARVAISPHGLNAVACPGSSFCLAVGNNGVAVSSTSPAGGAASWSTAAVDAGRRLISLSCPSVHFCAATDNASAVVTTSSPGGGASGWTAHTVDPGRWITSISCASPTLCVAVDRHGGVLTSTRPSDPHRRWARVQIPRESFVGVSCPTVKLCVAADGGRSVFVSTNPTGGRHAWRARTVLPDATVLLGVSCARTNACMLVNYENGTDVAFRPSRHPTALGIWHPDGDVTGYPHEGTAHGAVACVNASFCAGITHSDFSYGDGWVTTDLGRHWAHVALDDAGSDGDLLTAIACGGTSLCVAVDNGGGVIVGS